MIVDAVKSREYDASRLGHLIGDIRVALATLSAWEVRHVRRQGNKVAHVLANLAMHENMTTVWTIAPPDCISEMLKAEFLALPRMI